MTLPPEVRADVESGYGPIVSVTFGYDGDPRLIDVEYECTVIPHDPPLPKHTHRALYGPDHIAHADDCMCGVSKRWHSITAKAGHAYTPRGNDVYSTRYVCYAS